jgi:hypothetical protein
VCDFSLPALHRRDRDRRRVPGPGLVGSARVHDPPVTPTIAARHVAVTVDDHIGRRKDLEQRIESRRDEVPVCDREMDPFELEFNRFSRPPADFVTVHVAPYGIERRYDFQFVEQLEPLHVSGEQNPVHTRQKLGHLGPEPSMNVADQSDSH